MAKLSITNISKSYGSHKVLHDVTLNVPDGQFCAMLGPSGSGKTTVLRSIAGFVVPEAGSVELGGVDIGELPAHKRNIGIVFQSYALFPHLSVFENVAFGLRVRKRSSRDIELLVWEMLKLVGLAELVDRRPAQLSGGQQQRVALARALVIKPKLLLLDEPLSALDRKVREEMRSEIKRVCRETGSTTILVTHDQEEAMELSDSVVLMEAGRIRQVGTPEDLYHAPDSLFVADFLGAHRLPDGTLASVDQKRILQIADLTLPIHREGGLPSGGQPVKVAIQPEYVSLRRLAADGALRESEFLGDMSAMEFYGPFARATVRVNGVALPVLMLSVNAQRLQGANRVAVAIDPLGVHWFSSQAA